jgi:hypothetical protein
MTVSSLETGCDVKREKMRCQGNCEQAAQPAQPGGVAVSVSRPTRRLPQTTILETASGPTASRFLLRERIMCSNPHRHQCV